MLLCKIKYKKLYIFGETSIVCRQAKILMKNIKLSRRTICAEQIKNENSDGTAYKLLRAHLSNIGLAEQKDCRLCEDERERERGQHIYIYILCHCSAFICKKYRTCGRMFLSPQALEKARMMDLISLALG